MPDSDNNLSPGHLMTEGYKKRLIIIFAGLLLFVSLNGWVSPRIGFVGYTPNHFYLQDYAYHIILTKQFWFKKNGNIYDGDFQLEALKTYTGRPAPVAMPVAITPAALIVWLPFAYIANSSLPFSFSLWITVSLGILVLALWKVYKYLSPIKTYQRLPLALCGITVFSIAGLSAVVLGQTSFFAGGIISFIIYRVIRISQRRDSLPVDWPLIILVILAGLKPSYLIIGYGILLIYGRWRELLVSTVIVLVLTAVMTPLLTQAWPGAYIKTLHMYSSGNFPDIYAWSIVPRTMNIFRSAVSAFTGDSMAAISSTVISGLLFLGIVILSLLRSPPDIAGRPKLVVALIAGCLLFSPHSGSYEDILLIPVFVIVALTGKTSPLSSSKGLAIAGALFVCLLHNIPAFHHNWLWVFFVLKFMVLAGMMHDAGSTEVNPPSAAP